MLFRLDWLKRTALHYHSPFKICIKRKAMHNLILYQNKTRSVKTCGISDHFSDYLVLMSKKTDLSQSSSSCKERHWGLSHLLPHVTSLQDLAFPLQRPTLSPLLLPPQGIQEHPTSLKRFPAGATQLAGVCGDAGEPFRPKSKLWAEAPGNPSIPSGLAFLHSQQIFHPILWCCCSFQALAMLPKLFWPLSAAHSYNLIE